MQKDFEPEKLKPHTQSTTPQDTPSNATASQHKTSQREAPPHNESIDFEEIISWFGHYTPQLKKILHALSKLQSPQAFKGTCKDIFAVFRQSLFTLSQFAPGADRARLLHDLIDRELQNADLSHVSCKKGCSACCSTEKQITHDEAELLRDEIYSLTHEARTRLERQRSERLRKDWRATPNTLHTNKCPFLDEQGACSVYSQRPAVCRKHFVTSPAEHCRNPQSQVLAHHELLAEIHTSAALSLPNNSFGPLPVMLLKDLPEESDAASKAPQ